MVTHELTVFPDGRVDGSVSARNGDYRSHTLHFVLAEGLTGASAKLMVWAPGAEKATVYDTAKGNGSCTGQDVTVTPVLWSGPGRTRLQLELLNSAGDVVWQSRRFVAVVEDGIPDDAQPPLVDSSDATLTADNAPYGAVFYGAAGRAVGKVPDNRVKPRGWDAIPIDSIKETTAGIWFHRVADDLFWARTPGSVTLTSVGLAVKTRSDVLGNITVTTDSTPSSASPGGTLTLPAADLSSAPLAVTVAWTSKDGAAHTKIIRVQAAAATTGEHGILQPVSATNKAGNTDAVSVVSEQGVNAGYFSTFGGTGDETVKLKFADSHAWAAYDGIRYPADAAGEITIAGVRFDGGFAQIDMLDPETGYCMPCFLSRALETTGFSVKFAFRTDCATDFLANTADIYDYEENGYGPPTEAMQVYEDTIVLIHEYETPYTGGPWLQVKKENIERVGVSNPSKTLADIIDLVCEGRGLSCVKNSIGDILGICDGENTLEPGSLGHGSRWLVFVNGVPVTAPGFLTHIPVNANILLELVYTCADGIDVGFPYAGM